MDELRQSISEILVKWHMPTRQVAINEIMALIDSYSREARIDEISGVQLEYGHYVAQTFVNGKAMTILDRIAKLKALGGKEANHE